LQWQGGQPLAAKKGLAPPGPPKATWLPVKAAPARSPAAAPGTHADPTAPTSARRGSFFGASAGAFTAQRAADATDASRQALVAAAAALPPGSDAAAFAERWAAEDAELSV